MFRTTARSTGIETLAARYRRVRDRTAALAAPLSPEDAMVQSMPDASPAKWHLAHTTWFFEQFVLARRAGYRPFEPAWSALFNSYYLGAGKPHPRPLRGVLSQPTLAQVQAYRVEVDARIERAVESGALDADARNTLELGLQHEQQHQELLLTDIKHAFASNPLHPAYRTDLAIAPAPPSPLQWHRLDEAIVEVGAPAWPGTGGFAYDNESPRHRVLVLPFAIASRPVTNGEFRAFIADGGYRTPALWLDAGWVEVQAQHWRHPLYWDDSLETVFTLAGRRPIDPHAPLCHVSYYEADAFARWAGARLPTEFEWERIARDQAPSPADNFVERGALHPGGEARDTHGLQRLFGDVWEWTASAYTAYPGYSPWPGTIGEYNGKFMSGQWVLRGGSCASPRDHLRASYRNFFRAQDRWQFSGVRLARSLP